MRRAAFERSENAGVPSWSDTVDCGVGVRAVITRRLKAHRRRVCVDAPEGAAARLPTPVRIVILSGLSGSGKSVALHMLEDLGFYCIDNIPAALLKPFISFTVRSPEPTYERTAIGLDARNPAAEIASVPQLVDELKRSGLQVEVIFLIAGEDELLRRFAETRRRHPLSSADVGLREAMALERRLLEPVVSAADLVIDTSRMGVHALREIMHQRVEQRAAERLSITFESFGSSAHSGSSARPMSGSWRYFS